MTVRIRMTVPLTIELNSSWNDSVTGQEIRNMAQSEGLQVLRRALKGYTIEIHGPIKVEAVSATVTEIQP